MNKNQRELAKEFSKRWVGRGRERSESQSFWLSLLGEVYGIEQPDEYIRFEEPVQLSHKSFIDGFIDATHVMIEQKSLDKDLNEPIKQSDGTYLTPYQQAKRYAAELPYSKRPRWIIACNFAEFHIYDMENPQSKPEVILLENLETECYRLNFLIDKTSESIKRELELSIKAGEIVGRLYDALRKQYINPDSDESLKSLNKLCVRLVFCLYAESSGIFGKHKMFREYLNHFRGYNVRRALIDLFAVLNQKEEERDPYLDEKLKVFPYVNGGLFQEDKIEIPNLTDNILDLLLEEASSEFNWSGISPTIFGAVFESTLNPITRRSGGMHYTSIENIHKVIDPLFLDDLRDEFAAIKIVKSNKARQKKLQAFQDKLASLKFLDPACGSGNFLTETYLSLRRLENEVLKELIGAQITLGELSDPIKVSISQFYGIEVNDFAVTVAKTALWIAENQMILETIEIVHKYLEYLPIRTTANIVEGNALQIDWAKTDYIMGNPPFVGARLMSPQQKSDVKKIFDGWKNIGNLDYVSCWYKKTADFIKGTKIRAALVSTNSICQGDSVATLWKPLFESGVHIDFAHRTFRWDSESTSKAHVHCVIVGFSVADNDKPKIIFSGENSQIVQHINAYLVDAEDIFVESRNNPICDVPSIGIGNKPIDDGNYLFTEDEMKDFIKKEPAAAKYFKPWYGSYEFINNQPRYCLWLGNCKPNELRKMPKCMKLVKAVRDFRLSSESEGTRKLADTPTRFHVENMPNENYIVIPRVSSEQRRYIPMGFMQPDVLVSDSVHIVSNANLYHFGILTSSVHMAWTRTVCGRLKSDYRYSKDVVYNNFPWCKPTEDQRKKIEDTAQNILDARALYPDSSLADLYDEITMPPELRKAHKENDNAVMKAYGFDLKMTEAEIVAELMKMYQKLTS